MNRLNSIGAPRFVVGSMACLSILAAGCQHALVNAPAHLPAAPGAACLAEIAAFAVQQTGRQVTLVDGVFAHSDKLALEPALRRGPDGWPLDGRSRELPETFALAIQGGRCEVIHERTATRRASAACACHPAR